jgi:hypothetical protein
MWWKKRKVEKMNGEKNADRQFAVAEKGAAEVESGCASGTPQTLQQDQPVDVSGNLSVAGSAAAAAPEPNAEVVRPTIPEPAQYAGVVHQATGEPEAGS